MPDKQEITFSQLLPDEFEQVRDFYYEVIDGFAGKEYHPRWQKDVYPDTEQLTAFLGNGELFAGKEKGKILSVMALNHDCNDGYAQVGWQIAAGEDEVFVLHILAVHPSCLHRGIGGRMVELAVDYARRHGARAIRLDVLKGNLPANKLYERAGFRKRDTVTMYYPDTGNMEFELYELVL